MNECDDIAAIAAALRCATPSAAALLHAGRLRQATAATILVHQGDRADASWLILDGAVRSEVISPEGRVMVLATHPPGDLIGAFGQEDLSVAGSLTVNGTARLLVIPTGTMERLSANDSGFALAVAHSYARQGAQLLQRLATRISLTAPGRIHARLRELGGADHVIDQAPVVAALAVSVQTTRETASRTISTLERRGIIERTDGRLIIHSPRMLEEMIV